MMVTFVRLHGVREDGPVTRTVVDWLPFALSATITAGIAPLLLVQILYQREFYTANLLSFHRWMAILPVLIAAFYLLYVLKAKPHTRRLAAAVAGAVLLGVLFVAWSWTENHLLSLDREAWPKQYETGAMLYREPAVFVRLAFWVALALPTAAWLLLLQLHGGASGTTRDEAKASSRRLLLVTAVSALAAALLAPFVLCDRLPPSPTDESRIASAGRSHLLVAFLGLGVLLLAQALLARSPRHPARALTLGSLGIALAWWNVLGARERSRLARLDLGDLFLRHAERATSAGLVPFVVFAALALLVTAWIFRRITHALR